MPNGLFYRVGIDATPGDWNAPCRTDDSFCYVPISEMAPSGTNLDHAYDEFAPFVTALCGIWHSRLSCPCHLDPDFAHLTDGDAGSRARRIRKFIVPDSFSVFWAGLRWLDGPQQGDLVCILFLQISVTRVQRSTLCPVIPTQGGKNVLDPVLPQRPQLVC